MKKFLIETEDGQQIEVLTNNIYPSILGSFEKVTKKTIPNQPNIYRAFGLHWNEDVDLSKEIIVAYGYPNTHHAENGYAYTATNKKLGKLSDLPNLLNQQIINFNYKTL